MKSRRKHRLAAALIPLLFAAPGRPTQNPPPPITAKGDEIVLLGTHGGPSLAKERSEPATLLIVDGRPYLIDCGIGTMRRLLDAGVQSEKIEAIFITHDHPDHTLGLADVMSNDFLTVYFGAADSQRPFHIYGPPPTAELVKAAFNYIRFPYGLFAAENLGAGTLASPFETHTIDHDGQVFQHDNVRVTAAENTHFQLMSAEYRAQMKSYAYRFDTPHGAIVFTGDTGPSKSVERLAKGADVLVSEVEDLGGAANAVAAGSSTRAAGSGSALAAHMQKEHLSTKDVGEMATEAQVKSVVLYHLIGQPVEKIIGGVKEYYSGPVFAGSDLERYCLDTTVSAGPAALAPCP